MNASLVVLMTATFDPGPYADSVKRSTVSVRMADYARAMRFWANLADERIAAVVLCENSGADLTFLRDAHSDQGARPVELLGFSGNSRPPGMHYGYAELGTIDFALANSRLLAHADYLLKVTGRLMFPATSRVLDTLPSGVRFAVDCRRAYRSEGGPGVRARTGFMLSSRRFYSEHFAGRRDEMFGSCTHLEEFVALKLLPLRQEEGVVLRFGVENPAVGQGGHSGLDYGSTGVALKSRLRGLMRRIAPSLWF